MKNEMPSTAKNAVIDPAPRLQLAVVQSSRAVRPPRQPEGAAIPLRTASPALAPIEAQTLSGISPAARHGFGRTLTFFKRLLARIDVTNFPGSCCG
jgi:hypothetical protein